ncbi:MAG: carbohydrate ABC transporter permease [Candidatus Sumerlaeaceae bacterium]
MKSEKQRQLWGIAFAAPNLVLFAAFVLLPMVGGLLLAFQDYQVGKGLLHSPWVGLANFDDLFFNPVFSQDFYVALQNTVVITVFLVPINIAMALVLAALIFPLGGKAQAFYKAAFYLPGVVSAVVLAIVWQWMFTEHNGLINLALRSIGMDGVPWFSQRWTAVSTVILSSIPYAPGAGIILYLAALGRIPPELNESAEIDGASPLQRWRHVIFPLLKPTTLYLVVISTIESFKIFTPVYVMTRGRPANQSTSLVFEIYQNAFDAGEFGLASAEAVILLIITILFAMVQFRYLRSSDEY